MLLRCGVLQASSCARPRSTEPFDHDIFLRIISVEGSCPIAQIIKKRPPKDNRFLMVGDKGRLRSATQPCSKQDSARGFPLPNFPFASLTPRRFESFPINQTKRASVETHFVWSGIKDSNLRPPRPKRGALANCANPRRPNVHFCLVLPLRQKLRPVVTFLLSKFHSVGLLLGLKFWIAAFCRATGVIITQKSIYY